MRAFLWATVACALAGPVSCTQPPAGPITSTQPATDAAVAEAPPEIDPADALRQRAERLWSARQAQDWSAMFAFQDPQAVEEVTEEEYVAWAEENEPFLIADFRLGDVIVNEDMGWVQINCRQGMRKYPEVPPREVHRWEKWHIRDGRWLPVPPQQIQNYPVTPAERDAAAEQRLLDRFRASWEARQEEDWDRLFELSDPRARGDIPEDEFAEAQGLIEYLDCDVRWVEVIGDRGRVRVAIRHKLNDPSMTKLPPRTILVTEQWVRVDGAWYRDLTMPGE